MSLTQLYIHAVWSTHNRTPFFIDKEKRVIVYNHIKEYCKTIAVSCLEINGYTDHIHILFQFAPTDSVSEIIRKIKGESSFWINKSKLFETHFRWQTEYYADTISKKEILSVRRYIQNQEKHHTYYSFEEELIKKLGA